MGRKAFIRYTEEEKLKARDADMLEVISRLRGYTFRKDGTGYRCNEHDSLVVQGDRHTWYWNGRSQGGYGAIDWLVDIEGYDFTAAVGTLINKLPEDQQTLNSFKSFNPPPKEEVKEKVPFTLPDRFAGRYSNVYMYLTKTRCIPTDIVEYCFKNKLLYQDVRRNCVFVGYDESGEAKFAELRSSSSEHKFRKNVASSDKAYSFNIRSQIINDRVFVFESPIDLLSHAALNCRNVQRLSAQKNIPYDKNCWLKHNRLSLSGTSYQAALEAYLKRYPEIKNIACCLDNDKTGVDTSKAIYDYFTPKGYIVTIHHASIGKDYNDTLCALTQKDRQLIPQTQVKNGLSDDQAVILPPYYMPYQQPKR